MAESIHEKLKRVRKPHVHITMDIDGDGLKVDELPFVLGVMGDFSGDGNEDLKPLEDRRFIEVDRDNINDVLKRMTPKLSFKVDNMLEDGDESEILVDLKFESMDDFEPEQIVEQIPALKKLLETRNKLEQFENAINRGKGAAKIVEEILQNPEKLDSLSSEVGSPESGDE